MLNLERLRTLYAVSRHGSVSGAAEGLHVTTSAVSQQLAKLERETGQQLLAKNGRGVRLTDAGRLLADHAARILSQVELAQADLEAQRGQAVGELMMGAFPTAVRGIFPDVLSRLRIAHPKLRARLQEMEPDESVPAVVRGDIDLAVVLDWYNKPLPMPDGLVKAPLLDDPVDLAMPADHPLADREAVDPEEFADDEWISWPQGGFCFDWLMITLRGKGLEPRICHTAREHHTQLALIAAGLGVAVVPRLGRGVVPEGVRVVPVRQHTMRRHVYAIWRADADRRPSIRAAVDVLRGWGSGSAAERAEGLLRRPRGACGSPRN
ncbi:LysR family transcriptional regulator [Streptomyces sp. FXJ1.4098]|nr:LysR family transcriptional regulator [Streptomyces sp. FXJ1.4098]